MQPLKIPLTRGPHYSDVSLTDAVNQRCFSVWGLGCIIHGSLLLFVLSVLTKSDESVGTWWHGLSFSGTLSCWQCYQVVQTQPVFQTLPPSPWFWYNKLDDGGGLLSVGVFEPPDADVSWKRFYWILSPWKPQEMGPSSLSIKYWTSTKRFPSNLRIAHMRITRSDKCYHQIPEKLRINWCSFVV